MSQSAHGQNAVAQVAPDGRSYKGITAWPMHTPKCTPVLLAAFTSAFALICTPLTNTGLHMPGRELALTHVLGTDGPISCRLRRADARRPRLCAPWQM